MMYKLKINGKDRNNLLKSAGVFGILLMLISGALVPFASSSVTPDCDSYALYTTNADFNSGTLVSIYPEEDALYLETEGTTAYPTLWIANAGEDSLSKWDTNTNKELARYHTWFGPLGSHDHGAWDGPAPSRTCVDAYGNCYVANRDFDYYTPDVIKIFTDNWVDRNDNGVLDTSYDANDDGVITSDEMLPMIDSNSNNIIDPDEIVDERIAWATMVDGGGFGRSLSIDLDGNIWLGCYDSHVYYKLDGLTGVIIGGPYEVGYHTPYGSLVDKNGYLWGSSLSSNLLKMNTNNPSDYTIYSVSSTYGIALGYDKLGNTMVYLGYNSPYAEFNSSSETYSYPAASILSTLGVATDSAGNILVGDRGDGSVAKFAPDGTTIWHVSGQVYSEVRGIVVDADDNIWAVHRDVSKLCKYDGSDGTHLGIFDSGLYPYTYSDATGIGYMGSLSVGTWTVVHDSQAAGTIWNSVISNFDEPEGTSLIVKVRSSEDEVAWSPWETVTNGDSLSETPSGRYIQAEVTMQSTSDETPVLFDLAIEGTCSGEPNECDDEDNDDHCPDCNDNNPNSWRIGYFFYDGDDDGYYGDGPNRNEDGLIAICYGDTIPPHYYTESLGEDCDDSDPLVNPGVIEICNGIDDDCDGEIDEGCNQGDGDGDGDGDEDGDGDGDDDGVPDDEDNCPEIYNPDQSDSDGDGIGDVCDDDNGDDDGDDEDEGSCHKKSSSSSSSNGYIWNHIPIADANGLYYGIIDELIEFDGSNSYDKDGAIIEYSWNFGDGTTGSGETVTHSYSEAGQYLVTLTVIDNYYRKSSPDKTVSIIIQPNRPPSVPEISGPVSGNKDTTYSYAATSSDLDNDDLKYIFDWGDGNKDESEFITLPKGTAFSMKHNWDKAGEYTITVTVTDGEANSISELTISINEAVAVENIVVVALAILVVAILLLLVILSKRHR